MAVDLVTGLWLLLAGLLAVLYLPSSISDNSRWHGCGRRKLAGSDCQGQCCCTQLIVHWLCLVAGHRRPGRLLLWVSRLLLHVHGV